jgi:hypothetical protein
MVAQAHWGANAWFRVLMRERASIAADGSRGRRSTARTSWPPWAGGASIDTPDVEAEEADVSAISWALLGLATG